MMKHTDFFSASGINESLIKKYESSKKGARLKINEIKGHYHCSIVGTCLSLKELEKIKRKAGVSIAGNSTEHEIHGIFVYLAGEDSLPAKLMTKALDKKYMKNIREFSKLKTDKEIMALWQSEFEAGDIPGPYWALMSHPLSSEETLSEAFGQVHMLSHMIGRSTRSDIKRVKKLEEENDRLQEEIKESKKVFSKRFKELKKKYELEVKKTNQLFALIDDAENEIKELRKELNTYQNKENIKSNDNIENKFFVLEHENKDLLSEKESLHNEYVKIKEENSKIKKRNKLLELVVSGMGREGCGKNCGSCSCEHCPGIDLCGKKVLYVGGRKKALPKCREIVESSGGEFFYHDGGMESSKKSIDSIVSCADLVFCPIDCTSHDACLRLKKICRKTDKEFIPLRSSGVSSFVRYIQENN